MRRNLLGSAYLALLFAFVSSLMVVAHPRPSVAIKRNRLGLGPQFPPFPTPPGQAFYFAPNGGFGVGAIACTGQKPVDVHQNEVRYARSSGVAGDGGDAVATCIRETDGRGVELQANEPIIMESPVYIGTRGPVVESAGSNILSYTYQLDQSPWVCDETVTPDVSPGPFSHYRPSSGFELVADSSGGASHGCHQTVAANPGPYGFSAWLESGSLTSARLQIKGVGNSAGDRTCNITGLDNVLSRTDRKGCVTTTPYGSGLTAITISVLPGLADSDTGTITAVDTQLEPNDHITSYIPNGWTGTATRRVASATFPTLPATLTLSNTLGCAASDVYTFAYDHETFWTLLTLTGNGAHRGPYYPTNTAANTFDGVNVVSQARSSIYNSVASAAAFWSGMDGGLSIDVFDAGTSTTTYSGTMFGTTVPNDSMFIESSPGSQDGLITNVILDTSDTTCSQQAAMANIQRVAWVGDSLSARTDIPLRIPEGVFNRDQINGTNFAVIGSRFATPPNSCETQFVVGGDGTYNQLVVFCGANDLLLDTTGADLFATEKAWIEERAYRGIPVFWLDITPFGSFSGSNPSRVAERNTFNSLQASYCAAPAPGVSCIVVSPSVWDPTNHDNLEPDNTIDGLHFTQKGATAVTIVVANRYP